MAKSYVSSGQSIFVFGIDPTQRIAVDSTKEAATGAEIVAGFPIAMVGGKLTSASTAATGADMFYGASSSNINKFYGRVSLENWTAARANAELSGRYTIRPTVFLDSTQNEVTANPFTTTVATGDVGKAVHAITVAASDAFTGTNMLKWVVAGVGGAVTGFENVARIVAVRDNGEVELWLNGATPSNTAFTA